MQRIDTRTWGRWMVSFVGFPLAGLAARAVAGPVDDLRSALVGGIAAGATLGTVQALARGSAGRPRLPWVAASAVGLATGLAAGAGAVDFRTDPADLVLMGAISGAGIGLAQALVITGPAWRRGAWALVTPAAWALGWAITAQVIVDADRQHAVFGASGAIVVAALTGLVLAARPDSGWAPVDAGTVTA